MKNYYQLYCIALHSGWGILSLWFELHLEAKEFQLCFDLSTFLVFFGKWVQFIFIMIWLFEMLCGCLFSTSLLLFAIAVDVFNLVIFCFVCVFHFILLSLLFFCRYFALNFTFRHLNSATDTDFQLTLCSSHNIIFRNDCFPLPKTCSSCYLNNQLLCLFVCLPWFVLYIFTCQRFHLLSPCIID